MKTLRKFLYLLSPQELKLAVLLLAMMTIMAIFDTIGVASILPFMAVLTNPDLIETNIILNNMFMFSKKFGIQNNQEFLFALGCLSFILLILSLTFKTFTFYVQTLFVSMREHSIGKRLIEGYLHQPYTWFLSRNSATTGKTLLNEVAQVITRGMTPLMELISKSLIVIMLITMLVIANPKIALIVGFTVFGFYFFIYFFAKKFLRKIGKMRLINNQKRFITVSEAFGAIKIVKVMGLEQNYINNFSNSARIFARTQASSQIISLLPRYFLEAIAFGGILLIILYTIGQSDNFIDLLPILSLYIFSGYRLMPAVQQIYASFTSLTFVDPSLDILIEDLKNLESNSKKQDQSTLSFDKVIRLKNISYNYPESSRPGLKNISLKISAKSAVAFVGLTGSGKTTIVDTILGLLHPQKGSLEVDNQIITKKNLKSWQNLIGYIPQEIYLSDDSISANIAFGLRSDDLNQQAIEKVAKIANLHNFIINELPDQYQTIIGERGVKLSGGQRQRIGIARALYHNPKILIMDEATSALDNQTENSVMEAVTNFDKDITLILIAHRLSTVKKCDNIFFLKNGELEAEGTFDGLINVSKSFRDMAMKSK